MNIQRWRQPEILLMLMAAVVLSVFAGSVGIIVVMMLVSVVTVRAMLICLLNRSR